jgi:hypothetical protein
MYYIVLFNYERASLYVLFKNKTWHEHPYDGGGNECPKSYRALMWAHKVAVKHSYHERARGKCYAMRTSDWDKIEDLLWKTYGFKKRTEVINTFLKDNGYEK